MTYKKIISSGDDILSGAKRILKVRLVAATANTTAVLFDGTQAEAKDFCKLSVNTAGDEDKQNFGEGITLNKISVTLTGADAILYLYYS